MPTQTRIAEHTHGLLVKLANQTGKTHQEVIDRALRCYARDLFLDQVNEGFSALRANKRAWKAELQERAEWEATLADGDDG